MRKGGMHGGTDFRPPFVYVAKHPEIEPSCFIYITDGYGPAPDNPPPYPVLWILTGDGENPPHGDGSYAYKGRIGTIHRRAFVKRKQLI